MLMFSGWPVFQTFLNHDGKPQGISKGHLMPLAEEERCLLNWRKARRSMGNGDCVEVAPANGKIFVRDSKNPSGPALEYPADAWRNFLAEALLGNLD